MMRIYHRLVFYYLTSAHVLSWQFWYTNLYYTREASPPKRSLGGEASRKTREKEKVSRAHLLVNVDIFDSFVITESQYNREAQ